MANWLGHIVAILVITVWGTTFVSSKVLLNYGISPDEIFLSRFLIAYFSLLIISHRKIFSNSLKDELIMLGLGATGGSLYFLAENHALVYDTSSNVSILVGSCPLLTMLLVGCIRHEMRPNAKQIIGALIAFAGMTLVVLNGQLILHLNPLGDTLAILAAITWATYSLLMTYVNGKYPTDFITRKVFFYGILTILPFALAREQHTIGISSLSHPIILGNIIFLGLVASTMCYVAWNWTLNTIGTFRATNYIFFQSFVTLVAAFFTLDEPITIMAVIGLSILIGGMYITLRA